MTGDVSNAGGRASDESSSTSTSLLRRIKANEPEAWQRLTDLYGPVIYGWCRQKQLLPEDSADIVQEVFTVVARQFSHFRHDRSGDTFRGWLWGITRNKILEFRRRSAKQANAPGGTDALRLLQQLPDAATVRTDEVDGPVSGQDVYLRALELVRADFEDRTWQAFWRSCVDGHAAAHIAEDFGMSVPAVYMAKSRVKRRIREEFGDLLD